MSGPVEEMPEFEERCWLIHHDGEVLGKYVCSSETKAYIGRIPGYDDETRRLIQITAPAGKLRLDRYEEVPFP